MSSTDALWDELSRDTRRQEDRVARLLRRSMATATSTGDKAVESKTKRMGRRKDSPLCHIETTRASSRRSSADISATAATTGSNSCSGFNLQREINRLASELQSERKQAALALEARFLVPHGETDASVASAEDADTFAELAKPPFRRFNDRVEKVREVSVRLATRFLSRERDLLRYLPYLVPAIATRIDSPFAFDEQQQEFSRDAFLLDAFKRGRVLVDAGELRQHHAEQRRRRQLENGGDRRVVREASEEIRLLLLRLVNAVLRNALLHLKAASILHAYAFDILLLLLACAHDEYHEVAIESCATLELLSDHLVSVVKHFSVALVRSLAPRLLPNRLARVRIAAIRAVRALVTCPDAAKCKGSGSEAIVDLLGYCDENVIPVAAFYGADASSVRVNWFAKLGQDANQRVRMAFVEMVSDWMLHLPDRYDHESRLLPYLLNGLGDDCASVAELAVATLRELGDRFERDQGEEVLEMKQYGVDGKNPTYNYDSALPAPFSDGRPSLGVRLFVRARAKRFLNPVLREVGNWQRQTRARALRLLVCIVILCEESITSELHLLLSTLLRTWPRPGDANAAEKQDIERLRQVAQLTGRFTSPDTYMPLLLARVRAEEGVAASVHTGAALEVLTHVISGSLDRTLLPHALEVLESASSRHVIEMESPAVQRALAALLLQITQLLDQAVSAFFLQSGRLPDMERARQLVFELGSLLAAVAQHLSSQRQPAASDRGQLNTCAAIEADAQLSLELLAKMDTRSDMRALYATRGTKYLERAARELVAMLDAQWSPQNAAQLAFEQVLASSDVDALLGVQPAGDAVCELFETVLRGDKPGATAHDEATDRRNNNSNNSNSNSNDDRETRGVSDSDSHDLRRLSMVTVAGSTRRSRYAQLLSELLSRSAVRDVSSSSSRKQRGEASEESTAACLTRLEELTQAAIA